MRRLGLALAALVPAPAAATTPPPPLVIDITIDQLTGDLFDRYRTSFTGGLARLSQGTVFRNGNDGGEAGRSLGTTLKRASPDSRHVVVSGEASTTTRGSEPVDQRWYWTGRQFETDAPRSPLPRTVALANAGVARMLALPDPGLQPPAPCQGEAGTRFARSAGDYAAFTGSPALDGATLALAAGVISELGLGRDRAADLVSIDLASTGYVGSRFGAGPGDGTCAQLFSLDRDLGGFFEVLDRAGLHYAVALKGADSSAPRRRVPILLWRAGMAPSERPEAADTRDIVPTLAAMLGLPAPVAVAGKCLTGVATIICPKQ